MTSSGITSVAFVIWAIFTEFAKLVAARKVATSPAPPSGEVATSSTS